MRARLAATLLLAVLLPALHTSGCVSAFPASALDSGRGAEALERGTTRVQVGGGAGAAPLTMAVGGGAGARLEHQFLDDLAVSADVSGGIQSLNALAGGLSGTFPLGAYAGAQWNPFGLQWLALRVRLGGGVDTPIYVQDLDAAAADPSPYGAAVVQVALSRRVDDAVAVYLVPSVGVKQFFGTRESAARTYFSLANSTDVAPVGFVDTIIFPGLTGGLEATVTRSLSFYVSANATPAVIIGTSASLVEGGAQTPSFLVSPSANVQTGLAFTF